MHRSFEWFKSYIRDLARIDKELDTASSLTVRLDSLESSFQAMESTTETERNEI